MVSTTTAVGVGDSVGVRVTVGVNARLMTANFSYLSSTVVSALSTQSWSCPNAVTNLPWDV